MGAHDDRLVLDAGQVQRLVAGQFPQWADLRVREVDAPGWDNRTFRLGEELAVRLPSHQRYVAAVEKEQRWLPRLAPALPLPIPAPIGAGVPADGYPFPWSVNRWLPGAPARRELIADLPRFAVDLAGFLTALYAVDPAGGPAAGMHSFHRGASPAAYDEETRACVAALGDRIPAGAALEVWERGLASHWPGPPVWFHGDVASGNLLVRDGALSAVIDFGTSGVGDPACDLVVAWTLLDQPSRTAFRRAIALDDATWARARAWALWKALLGLAGGRSSADDPKRSADRLVLDRVIAEHQSDGVRA